MSKKITVDFAVVKWGIDFEGEVTGIFTPSTPDVMYLRNGDPGYPGDAADFELNEVKITTIGGEVLKTPIILDAKAADEFYDDYCGKLITDAEEVYTDQYDGPGDDYYEAQAERIAEQREREADIRREKFK
jgi:hypothetical protein